MTLVNSIDKIVEWLEREVCPHISLKVPDDYKNDSEYNVEYMHPAAFPLFVPGKEKLPPAVRAPIPSVCVQLMEGDDELVQHTRRLQLRLCLACWNPGVHGAEKLIPEPDPEAVSGVTYHHPTGEEAKTYTRSMAGWRDLYNFVDTTLRLLEGSEYIEGHRIVKEDGIKYGPFVEDGTIMDYYPYWHHWISFTVECGVVTKTPEIYENLL